MPAVTVRFNGQQLMRVELTNECYVIGRQEGCEIHIDNLGISRQHARFVRDGSLYRLEDLNSSNGCFVNGKAAKRYNLNDGDLITLGKYELLYEGGSPEAAQNTISHLAEQSSANDGSMNTMEMDGNAIRRRLEEMRQSATPSSSRSAAGVSSMGDAELHACRFQLQLAQRKIRGLQVLSALLAVAVVGLAAAVIISAVGR